MENKKDWKSSLLMPQTDFDMKAGLVEKEPQYRKMWLDKGIYQKALKANKENGKGSFILHDGPPYANGNLHVGHALNKILKDIILRNKAMNGFKVPFIYGWDTHGLPIENKMLETLKMSKDDLDPVELRKKAAEYALSQVEVQAKQFDEMSLFANLDNRYITLDKNFEVGQLELLKKMLLDGLVFKGLKPVYWSPSSQSALAEAEVEYADHVSPQVIVALKVTKGNATVAEGVNLLIMTTTPWTLPANSAVAVHENFNYDLVEANGKQYVVASELTESVSQLSKWEEFNIVKTFQGKEMVGLEYRRPIRREATAPVVLGHHVTVDAGTGLVHMAPLFGEDDYIIGKENNLEMIMHVDARGNFNKEGGEYEGMFYADANKNIGMFLDEQGDLLSLKFLKHSYPHDWRTHKPVIYRGVPQWFCNIKSLKQDIYKAIEGIKSNPDWGIGRLKKMIENRDEWTISRQRTWGVPIIVFYDKEGQPVIKEDILDFVIAKVKESGTDVWWELEADQLLPEQYRGQGFTKEMDIMDVWFDSGSTSIAVKYEGSEAPFDIYLEGSDQYRGWFNSSLINSVVFRNKAPFKTLLSHGFVLDGKQQKMSKSKGNVVDPLEVINKNGSDILRLWAANAEYTSDVSISDDILKQAIEIYRRIRNTIRFMLGNLKGFAIANSVELTGVHAYVAEQIHNLKVDVTNNYAEYKFSNVIKEVNKFLIDMSGFYFDFSKDTLYCEAEDSVERRSVQTNIYNLLDFLIKAIAPVLPTTAEEAYEMFNKENKEDSVFLDNIENQLTKKNEEENKWAEFFELKDEVYKAIEEAKKAQTIKRNNEAVVTVKSIPSFIKEEDIAKLLMVASVKVGDEIKVETFESEKCQRCWNHFAKGTLTQEIICNRCDKVVN